MKKTTTYLLIALGIIALGSSHARTWTSADGTKTFQGDLKSYNKESGTVKVTKGFRELVFKIDMLSEKDIEWITAKAEADQADKASKGVGEVEKQLDAQKIGSKLKAGVLSKLDGGAFVDYAMTAACDYYVVYYSGSW